MKRLMFLLAPKMEHIDFFQKKMVKNARKYGKVVEPKPTRWYGATANMSELRVRKEDESLINDWIKTNNIQCKTATAEPIAGENVDISLREGWTPRDYQERPIEWIVEDDDDKLLPFRPGDGKTFMCLAALSRMKKRPLFVIKPRYIDKWISDFEEVTNTSSDEVLAIRGGSLLREWMEAYVEEDQGHKAVIISNRTIGDYIRDYEKGGFEGIPPYLIAEVFRTGVLVIDEVHQDFNLNYRLTTYLNVNKVIGMSGTFVSKDLTIKKMMYRMFSKEQRIEIHRKKPHIDIYAIRYEFENSMIPSTYKYIRNDAYNHIMLEQHYMKSPGLLYDYLSIIYGCFESYINRRKDGDKCLIYCSSIALCYIVKYYICFKHPDLEVGTKVEGEEYSVILTSDVIVSTVQSSGTAFDIPNLITVVQTIALDSIQSNLQSLGRLREQKDKTTEFYYLFSSDIEKQLTYHINKNEMFRELAKSYRTFSSNRKLGYSVINPPDTREFEFVKFLIEYSKVKDLVKHGSVMIRKTKQSLSAAPKKRKRYWVAKLDKLERDIAEANERFNELREKLIEYLNSA